MNGKCSIAVLGAGTWGTALSRMLANDGHDITVWSAIASEVENLGKCRVHPNLPEVQLPDSIIFTGDMKEACNDKDIIVMAVPSVFVRSTAEKAAAFIKNGQIIADVAKGIEPDSLMTMTQVIKQALGEERNAKLVALSGPTHAEEVARDMTTTIVAACEDIEAAGYVQKIFSNKIMRVYTNADVLGVEICGALKNIIALAAGMAAGLGFGDNLKAAIITRGMAEISRLGIKMGCKEQTFAGLAGIGDLIVTATSRHSRNNKAGFLMGQGLSSQDAVKEVGMVVEGINALPAALELSEKYQVEMPLTEAVNKVVNKGRNARDVYDELMAREYKSEG